MVVFIAGQRIKILERLLLLGGKVGRYLEVDPDILVAATSAVDIRDALVAQTEDG